MKIISIDVGIKNLAFCILDYDYEYEYEDEYEYKDALNKVYKILSWDVINLCGEEPNCTFITEKEKKVCDKKAKYCKNNINYCQTHAKMTSYILPTKQISPAAIKKLKLTNLISFAKEYNIPFNEDDKKEGILKSVLSFINEKALEFTNKQSANNLDLVKIGIAMKNAFDEILSSIPPMDQVIIENQISPIANRMKTIQGMIAQYFIMKGVLQVSFISAANKLKAFTAADTKTEYKDRKKLSVEVTNKLLIAHKEHEDKNVNIKYKNKNLKEKDWINLFLKHKKKDDLADSFLQGIWFLQNKHNLVLNNNNNNNINNT
jgi:hypothetical protein